MNILKLEQVDKKEVRYLYQPEGRGEFGVVIFDLVDKKPIVTRIAPQDEEGRYANKAAAKICQFVASKNLPMEYTQAWY